VHGGVPRRGERSTTTKDEGEEDGS